MKILQITIHNIASIADVTVDFADGKLAGESLVLISGPTGAGKSTLLDAICLALYNRTPRLSNGGSEHVQFDKDNNPTILSTTNIVRRGTVEASATLRFEGNDGNTYNVQWAIRRTRGRGDSTGKWQPPTRVLTRMHDQHVFQTNEVANMLETLVGMDYTQFCRTTMLAQGDFTAFLRSKAEDKAAMLERILGNTCFSQASIAIYNLHKDASDVLKSAKINFDAIDKQCLADEQIDATNAEITETTAAVGNLTAQQQRVDTLVKWLERKAEIERNIALLESSLGEELPKRYRRCVDEKRRLDTDLAAGPDLATLQQKKGMATAAVQEQAKLAGDMQAKYNALDVPGKLRRQRANNARAKDLNSLRTSLASLDESRQTVKKLNDRRDEADKEARQAADQLPQLAAAEQQARQLYDKEKAVYDKQKLGADTAARELRSALEVGDTCPVCGNTIVTLFDEDAFESVLQPMRERLDELNDQLRQAMANHSAASNVAERLKRAADKARAEAERAAKELTMLENKLATRAKTLQVALDAESIAAALEAVERDNADINANLGKANEIQKQIAEANNLLDELKAAERQCVDAIAALQGQLQVQATVDKTLAEIVKELPTCRDYVPQAALAVDAQRLGEAVAALQLDVVRATGGLKAEKEHLKSHTATPPEDYSPESDIKALRAELEELRASIAKKQRDIGSLQQRLCEDADRRKQRDDAATLVSNAEAQVKRYERLNTHFGSSDGKKLRNIALGFILGDLLNRANFYLKQFDNHYQLCNAPGSLTILLRDLQLGNQQSASTNLSGGETFMVSLALALALAQVGNNVITADTLFIDEGFGTLSDDSLQRVIDCLEQLHQMDGRRVVLISHVTALRDRIAAQIAVNNGTVVLRS